MSARQDFPPIPTGANVPGGWGLLHLRMCDEIDRLNLSLAWWERIAEDRGEENERLRKECREWRMLAECGPSGVEP